MTFRLLKAMLGLELAKSDDACATDCTACPAAPGTVTPHGAHVLIRLAPPLGTPQDQTADIWWPEKVDE